MTFETPLVPAPPSATAPRPSARVGGVRGGVRLLAELTKARITFFVMLSVATGWVFFRGRLDLAMLVPMGGVFLLACGSAALNQVQEANLDARMPRTRGRPIPTGRLARDTGLFIAVLLILAGIDLLAYVDRFRMTVVTLGLIAVVWYNGVYFLLKRWTAFAVVPGSLLGAIPPVIGWCAAGGLIHDARILDVAALFFIWQIPHFWLLLVLYGPEYEAAGMPALTGRVSPTQLGRMTFAWVAATVSTGLALAAREALGVPWNLLILVASIALVFRALAILRHPGDRRTAISLFLRINAYVLVVMGALIGSALAGPV